MSWDEKIFGALYRLVRPKRSTVDAPGAALLAPLRARLRLLGTGLVGEPIEVLEAEAEGGCHGGILRLPRIVDVAPGIEDNELAYVLRVVLGAIAHRLALRPAPGLGATELQVFTLLAMTRVLVVLDDELPRVRGALAELAPLVAARRAPLAGRSAADAALEVLARRILGASLEGASAPALAWATRAEAAARESSDAAQLTRCAEELARAVSGGRTESVVVWGLLQPSTSAELEAITAAEREAGGASGTERKGKNRENVQRVSMSDESEHENPMTHSFEKVHTAEEYSAGKKSVDGADEMGEQGDALDELDMRETIRSRERARSLYRAEINFEGELGDLDGGFVPEEGIPYDEWDVRTQSYLRAHCWLLPSRAPRAENEAAVAEEARAVLSRRRREVRSLEARFARVERARRWRSRQPDGAEIDIDALIDRYAALAAGNTGPEKLHMAKRPHTPSLAVMILLDTSLSTDAWIGGKRVLDITKEATVVLGAALAPLPIHVGISAFYSNTRRDCRFLEVKSFRDSWTAAHSRLARLAPTGYTRIGPALRHGTSVLKSMDARRKLLLLISDGKPTDFDRYEGRHGVGDVRQAVREGQRAGVRISALALDPTARRYLPQMFGPSGFHVLHDTRDLVLSLGALCVELSK